MTLRGKRVVREGQAGGDGLREPGGNGLLGVRRRRAGKWWVASLAVTRMPPPMSTMTVGDDGANEVETHSSSDNIRGDAGKIERARCWRSSGRGNLSRDTRHQEPQKPCLLLS